MSNIKLDIIKRKSIRSGTYLFLHRDSINNKILYKSPHFISDRARDRAVVRYIQRKKNTNGIFAQLENCKFEKPLSLGEVKVLVNFSPVKVAKAIKELIKQIKVKCKFNCSCCKRKFFNKKSLNIIEVESSTLLLCNSCKEVFNNISNRIKNQ